MGFTISTKYKHGTNDKSHENPGSPGTKLKVFRNDLKIFLPPYLQSNVRTEHIFMQCVYIFPVDVLPQFLPASAEIFLNINSYQR